MLLARETSNIKKTKTSDGRVGRKQRVPPAGSSVCGDREKFQKDFDHGIKMTCSSIVKEQGRRIVFTLLTERKEYFTVILKVSSQL